MVVCRIGGAKSKETRYSMLMWGLVGSYNSPAVLNLQMKKPICKCRTVIVVGSYQTSFNILYLVSLLFAPPILRTTITFSIEKFLIYLFPSFFFLCQECSVNIMYGLFSVFVAMHRTLRFLSLVG